MKTILQGRRMKSAAGGKWQHEPIVSTNSPYRDPALGIRGAQSQTVGSMKAMRGRHGTPEAMRKAAQSTDRFTKRKG
jgi:hypothetical protein